MLRFKSYSQVPPLGGWKYTQIETGTVIHGGDWQDLLRKIVDHRKANNLPVGADFETAVEVSICENLEKNGVVGWCRNMTRGLGDQVYDVAHPIAKLIDRVAGTNVQECGACKSRREFLNKWSS